MSKVQLNSYCVQGAIGSDGPHVYKLLRPHLPCLVKVHSSLHVHPASGVLVEGRGIRASVGRVEYDGRDIHAVNAVRERKAGQDGHLQSG